MPESAITIRDLTVARGGRTVLDKVSLDVAGGRITGLLGPSGCGKTTLMRAIVGVQIVAAGSVTVLGLPAGAPALRPHVGYVTQAPAVYRDLTVDENLAYFSALTRCPPGRGDELIAGLRLEPVRSQLAGTLSGGEIARL